MICNRKGSFMHRIDLAFIKKTLTSLAFGRKRVYMHGKLLRITPVFVNKRESRTLHRAL